MPHRLTQLPSFWAAGKVTAGLARRTGYASQTIGYIHIRAY